MATPDEPKRAQGELSFDKAIVALRDTADKRLKRALANRGTDNVCHNYGFAVAIVLGAVGSALPAYSDTWVAWGKILTAVSTAIFTIERSLKFGERWVFHRRLSNSYDRVLLDLGLADAEQQPREKLETIKDAYELLAKTIESEGLIPGALDVARSTVERRVLAEPGSAPSQAGAPAVPEVKRSARRRERRSR